MRGNAPKWDWSQTTRFEVRFPVDFLEAVDRWRAAQPDVPNRSEAIRRLAELGLNAREKKP